MSDLFVEIFPVEADAIPPLCVYRVTFLPQTPASDIQRIGQRLAARLRQLLGGHWLWSAGYLVTDDVDRNPIEVTITVDSLKSDQSVQFAALDGVEMPPERQVSAQAQADYVQRVLLKALSGAMQAALNKHNATIRNARVEREHKLRSWVVDERPAISLSIASRLVYHQSVQDYLHDETDSTRAAEKVVGLWVSDPRMGARGAIMAVEGQLHTLRAGLLADLPHHLQADIVERSPDSEWVVRVRVGRRENVYLASSVKIVIRLPHLPRFDVDPKQAIQTLQMQPRTRAMQVRSVSTVTKEAGLLANAYNARTMPEAFFSADFEMNLRFQDNRVCAYNPQTLPVDFLKRGVYKLRPEHQDAPVRVCVVNTLELRIEDFVEAMRRQLSRDFPFTIEIVRERRVRVVSRSNLESAVRVVEKENPDVILAFFPDEVDADDDEDDDEEATAAYIKSLTLGRGLPIHVIRQSTLDDPEAMPGIIMSILGKIGSAPFVLTEPVEYADFVVGLDIVRQSFSTMEHNRLTAIARVYGADGEFLHYTVRELELEENKLPFVLMRDLFPQKRFAGKRIMVHYAGVLEPDLLTVLTGWGQAIKAQFFPVEIIRFGAPRIYAIDQSGVVQPPWGSAFKLSDTEALLISSLPQQDITPQPLHIRTISSGAQPLPITEALRSVLVWTRLAYGAERLPKLPVTVINTDQLGAWLRRGNKFSRDEGYVPFWL
jgi:hypothetical protein